MNLKDLRAPSSLVQRYGVKMLCYGRAGIGKTPSLTTLPNPVILAVESGLLSIRNSNVPVYDTEGKLSRVVEFFDWLQNSGEAKQFDSVGIDSFSEITTLLLKDALPRHKDPRQAYQEVAGKSMSWLRMLNSLPSKHVAITAKLEIDKKDDIVFHKPMFEGQKTYIDAVHLFDEIFYYDVQRLRGQDGKVAEYNVICTRNTATYIARDRLGVLNQYESIDLGAVIGKLMM